MVIAFRGRGYCVWEPWLVRLLSPCEGRVVKGVTSNGTKNTGETGAAFACPGFVGACDREVARHVAPERFRCARCGEGRRRRLG